MSNLLHACIFNLEPSSSDMLASAVKALNFVRFTGEVNNANDLAPLLQSGAVSLVFFHLDPKPAQVVEVIEHVSTKYPDMGMIALSHKTAPDAILAPMRAGCDQFVCEPIEANDLANAVARVASKRLATLAKSRCICVTSPSGGGGATTIACNLALEIGHLVDRECALIDLDLEFGDVSLNFDAEPKFTFHDLADAGTELDKSILISTMLNLPCKVSLLARPEQIEQTEAITPEVVHRVIELMRGSFENIVIDVPGRMDARNITAVTNADLVLVVCQLLVPSVRNAKRYIDTLRRMGVPEDRIEVVINRSDGRNGRLTEADLAETIKKPPFACVPNDYQFVARSIDIGRPIAALDRGSPVRAAIRQIAKRVINSSGTDGDTARRGFLSRLLAK